MLQDFFGVHMLKRSETVGDFFSANDVARFLWCSHVETVGNGRGFFSANDVARFLWCSHVETVGNGRKRSGIFFLHMMLPDFFGVHMLKRSETVGNGRGFFSCK